MQNLLQEISVIPGVTGSCIYDKKRGPLCNQLQQGIREEELEIIGTHLARLMQMGTMAGHAIESSHFRFDRFTLMGIPLNEDCVLVTICDAQANCSLVATTAAMLAQDMRFDQEDDTLAHEESLPEEPGEEDETFLHPLYEEIEQVLTAVMGPVAILVMHDCLERWQQSGPAIYDRIPELIDMLIHEIDRPDLADEFRQKVQKLL